jgi:hypothetical protein
MQKLNKTLMTQVSIDVFHADDRLRFVRSMAARNESDGFAIKVRQFAMAPSVAILRCGDGSEDSATMSGKQIAAESGASESQISKMVQVNTILRFGARLLDDPNFPIGRDKMPVSEAYGRLMSYRDAFRAPEDRTMTFVECCGFVLSDSGEERASGLVEMFGSFPGGLTGVYNIARGMMPDGSPIPNDDDDDDDDDDDNDDNDDAPATIEAMIARVATAAASRGLDKFGFLDLCAIAADGAGLQ